MQLSYSLKMRVYHWLSCAQAQVAYPVLLELIRSFSEVHKLQRMNMATTEA